MNDLTYEKYKELAAVKGFIAHFLSNSISKGKSHWSPRYKGRKGFQFEIKHFSESLEQYSWPSSFISPQDSYGLFENQQKISCETWEESKVCLQSLSLGLKKSIELKNEENSLQWCDAILTWGMGTQKKSTLDKLTCLFKSGILVNHLKQLSEISSSRIDIDDMVQRFKYCSVDAYNTDWMSSGLSKIIALCSEKIIILDSRVGAILCEYINDYLRDKNFNDIPKELQFSWANGRASKNSTSVRRRPLPLKNGTNHSTFKRNSLWYKQQVLASWLINAILEENKELFKSEGTISQRIHAFEASLFMLGYNLDKTEKSHFLSKSKTGLQPQIEVPNTAQINVEFWIDESKKKLQEFNNNKRKVADYIFSKHPEITLSTFREIMQLTCQLTYNGANTYYYNCRNSMQKL